jgi:hypothetical protein
MASKILNGRRKPGSHWRLNPRQLFPLGGELPDFKDELKQGDRGGGYLSRQVEVTSRLLA